MRAGHAAWIVGGSGGSVDVDAPADVHAAIETLLAAPPDPLFNDGSDGEFRARSSSTFDMAQRLDDATRAGAGVFFNDGADGEIRSRLENVFDRPLSVHRSGGPPAPP